MKQEPLFDLIQSLSRSEKRYFSVFCTREASGKNYLALFRAIDKQSVYDEAAVRQQFRKTAFVRQLHVTKNYLRRLIMKSLRNYHAEISADAEVRDCLRNAEILFNKELYSLCEKEIARAEAIATTHEQFAALVEIKSRQRRLAQTRHPHDYAHFKEILSEQKASIEKLAQINVAWLTAVSVSRNMYQPTTQSAGLRNITLKTPDEDVSLEQTVLHHNIGYLLSLSSGDAIQAEQNLLTLINRLEKHPSRITEDPGPYVSSINNLVSYYVFSKRYEDALVLIQKAKNTYESWKITASNRNLLRQILRTYNIELEVFRDSGMLSESTEFIRTTEQFVETHVQKIPKDYLVSFWFQFASIKFRQRNYSQALEWVNRIMNARFKSVRQDIQAQAHLLNLMIHLEQENLMVLRYFVDSTRRFLKKIGYTYPYIDVLMKFFTRMGNLPTREFKQAYRDLQQQLYPTDQGLLVPEALRGFIDFRSWLEAKLQT